MKPDNSSKVNPLPITSLVLDGAVAEVAYPDRLDKSGWVGSYSVQNKAIEILRSQSPTDAFKVLIHELFHHIWDSANLGDAVRALASATVNKPIEVQEFFVAALANRMWSVLSANKDTLKGLGPLWDTLLIHEPTRVPSRRGKRRRRLCVKSVTN